LISALNLDAAAAADITILPPIQNALLVQNVLKITPEALADLANKNPARLYAKIVNAF
jgi:hypothetical protein